jgi:hypothetical protein
VKALIACIFLALSGCGYRFSDDVERQNTISVPFIKGDGNGLLTSELIHALGSSGHFEFRKSNSNLELQVAIVSEGDERIGYRYDRNPTTEKLRKNIIGVENRETISVEAKLIDVYTQQVILGPETITASADYDYVDYNSVRDLVFFQPGGKPTTIINFSLGQLDSIEGAHDDAQVPIFRKLAQKIVDGLIVNNWKS